MVQDRETPVVSVLVATYNHERFISQALESVLCQKTDFPYEVLIGEDASQDSTPGIVDAYQRKYPDIIQVFHHEHNLGTTRNAYFLMQHARGKYLATCEGDDYWTDPLKLSLQVDFLEKHPDYVGCSHRVRLVNMQGEPLRCQYLEWIWRKRQYSIRNFRGIFLPGHGSTLLRRNIFLDKDRDYSVIWKANPWISDRTSNLIFSERGDFYKLDRVMSCYRQDDTHSGKTVTSRLYGGVTAEQMDYEYTRQLEEYAKQHLNIKPAFGFHKAELLITETVRLLKHPTKAQARLVKSEFNDIRKEKKWPVTLTEAAIRKVSTKAIKRFPEIFFFMNKEA